MKPLISDVILAAYISYTGQSLILFLCLEPCDETDQTQLTTNKVAVMLNV